MPFKNETYEGKDVISIWSDERYKFTFGLQKAKLLMEHYDDVVSFVKKNDPSFAPQQEQKEQEQIVLKKLNNKWTISDDLTNDKSNDGKPF